jgi:DNA-binding NarL/FixJ family response regulator
MVAEAASQQLQRTRVLIVEDHPIVRAVVRAACEASDLLFVIGEADGEGALEACRRLRPDVVVLDQASQGPAGFETARAIHEHGSAPRLLVLTDRIGDGSSLAWIRLGVEGLLPKSSGVRTIARAIETVAAGGRVVSADQHRRAVADLGRLVRATRLGRNDAPAPTERELEVLRLLAEGLTIRQVATRTRISPRTVESHVTKLYRKLEVRTRVQAIARGAALGYVEIRPEAT